MILASGWGQNTKGGLLGERVESAGAGSAWGWSEPAEARAQKSLASLKGQGFNRLGPGPCEFQGEGGV